MYLHLGQDTVVKTDDIVAIYDLDTSTVSKWTKEYLKSAEKEKRVVNVSYDLPKSFIVCKGKNSEEETIYICPLSSRTLMNRQRTIISEEYQ